MRRTHVVFAAGFTMYVIRFLSFNYLLGCYTIGVLGSLLGALLPDLDLYYKHRMTLHNIFSLTIIGLLFYASLILLATYAGLGWIGTCASTGFILGYATHVFLDMFTIGGVSILYPFSRSRLRLARLRANSRLANFFFTVLGLFLALAALVTN
ncbi:MAG: metal-dependent hydrolase [Pyrodictiaceae archaeon]